MKVFISQPMTGLTNDEILKVRDHAITYLTYCCVLGLITDEFEIIDSFIQNPPNGTKRLYLLGEAIKKLSEADICIFVNGWENSIGCKIEHECCTQYDIPKIYFNLEC